MSKGQFQSENSYYNRTALQIFKEIIDTYCNIITQTTFTESVGIGGPPESGKTFCMLYNGLYSIPKVFYSTVTARMRHRSLKMVTQDWHLILSLRGNEENVKIRIIVQSLLLK